MEKCWYDYKTVVVSGASSGIGKGIVKKLIEEHHCTVIGIARNEKKMLELVEELGNRKDRFSYSLFDVSVKENWESFAAKIKKSGVIPDMIINNAGILPRFDKFLNYSLDEIEKYMQINFFASIYSMQTMLPLIFNSSSAALVNVASSAALCSLAGTSIYSASKAALKSMTDAVREEYKGQLYVGLICPGFTKTNIFSNQKRSVKSGGGEKVIQAVSTDCDKMVEMILKGIEKKKKDMVFGIDARFMHYGTKVNGPFVSSVSSTAMKISGLELFDDVFSK